ncbi:MAG: outer membrane protein assembly factor BamC [Thiotrichales bacterium]|nr:outer membrane protein assembly factor BamC [Thiotrichales bacterium]
MTFFQMFNRAVILVMTSFLLISCSSTASKNANDVLNNYDDSDVDYRATESKLEPSLDVPPDLLAPRAANDGFAQALATQAKDEPRATIPTYKAQNIQVQSDLSERWLVIKGLNDEQVWKGVQAFLVSAGFKIKDARKDTGFIKTEFTPRKEIVPPDAMGPISRVLNSWRPELADGAYDRIIARVVYDANKAETRVYFYNTTIYDASSVNDEDAVISGGKTGWQIRPYSPLIEAETLYQALIFFGTSQQSAMNQIATVEKQRDLVDGSKEFDGVVFDADKDTVWSYLVAMIYRSGWQIDHMKPQSYAVWVKIPEGLQQKKGFMSKLAFWNSDDEHKPATVILTVENVKDATKPQSLLRVHAKENATPLSAEQQKAVVESMGLLAQ